MKVLLVLEASFDTTTCVPVSLLGSQSCQYPSRVHHHRIGVVLVRFRNVLLVDFIGKMQAKLSYLPSYSELNL
jgi:hypothetical protein